jgi:predicted double-glycine peptidase
MNLWLMASVALLCALAGVALGWWFSRLRSPYWMIGYFIPVTLVFVYALGFYVPGVLFMPPFSWLMLGIRKFMVFGFITTLVLTTPMLRLPHRRTRVIIAALMAAIVFGMCLLPFITPMLDREQLSHLKTNLDRNGICLQTTDYTCGPASAVTVLRKLGLPAEEGQIAIYSCTSFQEGTPEDMLAGGLEQLYARDGLSVQCRTFKSVADLKTVVPMMAVVKYGLLVDHWVAVLGVTDSEVLVGDPLGGLARLSYQEFAGKWRFTGVVVQRKAP